MLTSVSRLVAITLVATGLSAVAPAADAATITVTTTKDIVSSDDGKCSLREAVTAANIDAPSGTKKGECRGGSPADELDIIRLAERKTYVLTIEGADDDGNQYGDLDITDDLAIYGARKTTIRQDAPKRRVIDVRPGISADLRNVTITGGEAPDGQSAHGIQDGENGGGIRNLGTLLLIRVRVVDNVAGNGVIYTPQGGGHGGAGGGVYSDGLLIVLRSVITGNRAGNGAAGLSEPEASPGRGGDGGGVKNGSNGILSIERSTISSNNAGTGGAGAHGNFNFAQGLGGGAGGSGGGISSFGTLSIDGSVVSGNAAGPGGVGGNGVAFGGAAPGGPGGPGGFGGGLSLGGSFEILTTTVSNNASGTGGAGGSGAFGVMSAGGAGGDGGHPGGGGGIDAGGEGSIERSTIASNVTAPGGLGGAGGPGTPPGPQGAQGGSDGATGGGIVASFGSLDIRNSTISGNQSTDGHGGGIYATADVSLNNVTVTLNAARSGGGIRAGSGDATLYNSILAGNTADLAPDCYATVRSNGHNIVTNTDRCDGVGSDATADPLLGSLRDNGGPTKTHAIGKASPARNNGDPGTPGTGGTTCEERDQRGKKRTICDSGAYEYVRPRR